MYIKQYFLIPFRVPKGGGGNECLDMKIELGLELKIVKVLHIYICNRFIYLST